MDKHKKSDKTAIEFDQKVITELQTQRDDLQDKNEDLHKKLIILRNAKCPYCHLRFTIQMPKRKT